MEVKRLLGDRIKKLGGFPLLILNYVRNAKCSVQPLKCRPTVVIHDQESLSGRDQ